jgi:hypothetical protein
MDDYPLDPGFLTVIFLKEKYLVNQPANVEFAFTLTIVLCGR